MRIEIINEENYWNFGDLLTGVEIDGIGTGRFTVFGAYDEGSGESMGVMVVEVKPEYILLRTLYTRPEHRGKGVASALLDVLSDRPDDAKIPVVLVSDRATVEKGKAEPAFLLNKGFSNVENTYRYVDIKAKSLDRALDDHKSGSEVKTLNEVDHKALLNYVAKTPHDTFLAFPDSASEIEGLAECTICVLLDGIIKGAILAEEGDDVIIIRWFHADDDAMLERLFSVFKTMLEMEFSPRLRVRFLAKDETEAEAITGRFKRSEESPILIYRLE